jgi:hypothetical protein
MDFSCLNGDTKNSIISKINWMGGGVTYQGVIPPKGFENGCPNLEIENRAAREQENFFRVVPGLVLRGRDEPGSLDAT